MKLTAVGKKRPFIRGLLLTILTVGLYAVYWAYKAPHEVYAQFELDEERRDEGVIWLVVGLVVPVLLFVYLWKSVEHVRYVRRRFGLHGGVTPAGFVGLVLVGPVVTLLLAVVLVAWPAAFGDPGTGTAALGGAAAASGVLIASAYFRFQRSINEVWDAWTARAAELRAPRPVPPPA